MNILLKPINCIFGFYVGLVTVLGFYLERDGEIPFSNPVFYILVLALAIAVSFISGTCFAWLSKPKKLKEVSTPEFNSPHIFITSFLVIFILLFITFLGVYPGFFTYDANYEITETIARNFTTQQPLLHVLLMGFVVQGVHFMSGDYNIAIACFILTQAALIALAESFLVKELNKSVLSRKGAITFSVYLGLFPVPVMYSLCSAKDGLFGATLYLIFIFIKKLCFNFESWRRKDTCLFIIITALMMLFRPNGMYAYIVFAVIVVCALLKVGKSQLKVFVICSLISVVSCIIISKGLSFATHAADYGKKEALSVPIQQMSRLYAYDKDSLTDEEISKISSYIPEDVMILYNPKCADGVKFCFNEEAFQNDAVGFVKLWGTLFMKHPAAFLDAHAMTSYGLLSPGIVIDGYKGNQVFTFTYGDSSYFGYEVEEPGSRASLIPSIDSFYKWLSLDPTIQKIPVISLFFSPGFMLILLLFIICAFLSNKKGIRTIPYLLPLCIILTSLLGPMSLVRYSFFLWVFVPIGFIDLLSDRQTPPILR